MTINIPYIGSLIMFVAAIVEFNTGTVGKAQFYMLTAICLWSMR